MVNDERTLVSAGSTHSETTFYLLAGKTYVASLKHDNHPLPAGSVEFTVVDSTELQSFTFSVVTQNVTQQSDLEGCWF